VTLNGRLDARGTPGGTVAVTSGAGTVLVAEKIRAGGQDAIGGSITLTAAGSVIAFSDTVSVFGDGGPGGSVVITAGGVIDAAFVNARGLEGGTVAATAADIDMRRISVRGNNDAGAISLTTTSGDVAAGRLDGRSGHGIGGQVDIDSAANVAIDDAILDGESQGGTLLVVAAGNVELGPIVGSSDFDVTGSVGGVIDAHAMGNLTARGDFLAEVGGCIGLSADLVLETSAATFDVPLTSSCP
jgi:hypothetical protein